MEDLTRGGQALFIIPISSEPTKGHTVANMRTILIALVAAAVTQPAVAEDFSVVNSNRSSLRRNRRELGKEQKIRGAAGLGIKGKKTKQLDDDDDDDDDDEKKKQMKKIQSENDDRKGVNDKLRDRDAGDRMKEMKMKKTVEDWVDDADEDEDEGKRKKKKNIIDDEDDDDNDKKKKYKEKQMNMLKQGLMDEKRQNKDRQRNKDKQANEDKQNKKSKTAKRGKKGTTNTNMEQFSDVVDGKSQTNQRPLSLYPPWKDKDTLSSALDYLNIDPQKWENMSKEKKKEVIQMMDGELSIDFTSPITATSDKPKDDKTVDIRDVDWGMVEHSAAGGGTIYEDGGDIIYDPEEETFDKPSKWNFVSASSSSCHEDTTVQLESFEDNDNIIPSLHGITAMKWTTPAIDPWSPSKDYASDGMWSTMSGLTPSVIKESTASATPTYSNMTLIIEENFDGGVMTFKVLGPGLGLPYEALFVMVDDRIEVTIGDSTTAADDNNADGWVEYSVPVEYGTHEVKWVHVYNPFGLDLSSLPPQEEKRRKHDDSKGLFIDDVRFAKFTKSNDKSKIDIINGHCDSSSSAAGTTTSSPWQVIDDGQTIIASSSDITNYADIQFVIFSAKGGMLTYGLHTSTTAPMDDFAILLNSGGNVDKTVEAIFGNMSGYEVKSLSVPKGKVKITLRHRKDPGMLGESLLGTLGTVSTDGRSSLKDLRFEAGWQ